MEDARVRRPVFLDHASTTPMDPRAFEAMAPYFTERFGHASSRQHLHGAEAAEAVAIARGQLARLLDVDAEEIVFTSGGTESANLAVRGTAATLQGRGNHIVTTEIEHPSVLAACRRLENEGLRVTRLPVDRSGRVDPASVAAALTPQTLLVSIQHANHETGVIQPVREIGEICRVREVALHVDAAATCGILPLHPDDALCDLMTISAHKMYGPMGIGALYVRRRGRRARLAPLLEGGGHERGLRPGTLPVPLAVGFGAAAEICRVDAAADAARLGPLRDRLEHALLRAVSGTEVVGDPAGRVPTISNLSFHRMDAESLLLALRPDVSASSGSGCTTDAPEPSYVLAAMGLPPERLPSAVRFSLGRWTTASEVDFAAAAVAAVLPRLRALLPGQDRS